MIPPALPASATTPGIIGFRNVLIHGYDLVDHALVWSTIETQLPILLRDVARLLTERAAEP